jgi:PmbA protein
MSGPELANTKVPSDMDPTTNDERGFSEIAEAVLSDAAARGADQVELSLYKSTGASVSVRMGELETVEYDQESSLVLTVYFDHHTGSASTGDLGKGSVEDAVRAACSIARYTGRDDCMGLADSELMAEDFPDLELQHEWNIDIPEMGEIAMRCEEAARSHDERISNSEGASVSSHSGSDFYANSHGFSGGSAGTRHSVSVCVLGSEGDEMQRGYWYTSDRNPGKLQDESEIGRIAAERTVRRLGARQVPTAKVPVLYESTVASSLVSHFISAIGGGLLYKKASFMVDQLGEAVFASQVDIMERPLLPGGIGSAAFDSEGVATASTRKLVEGGVLQGYVLGSYTARKMNMQTTANSGGVRNVLVQSGEYGFDDLVSQMDTGLLVTELIGSGINMVTGDYSRGAAGYWVENGQIQFPVEGVTVAGNLRDMFLDIAEIGTDIDARGNIHCGSVLLNQLTVAGS